MLAARRLMSHSHGPGRVSSKSLTSKTSWRSGEPKAPKFERWASPHACTENPDSGLPARSAAMIAAAPRKKVNGVASMRPWRRGMSSLTRVAACCSSTWTGSGRSFAGRQSAWLERDTADRAALPAAARSAAEGRSRTASRFVFLLGAVRAMRHDLRLHSRRRPGCRHPEQPTGGPHSVPVLELSGRIGRRSWY